MQKRNLLYIDNDLVSRILVTEALSDKDVEIVYASTGKDAIDCFKQNPYFNLVIIELALPDMEGIDVIEEIRKANPLVPVIAVSNNLENESERRCLSQGVNHVMEKPIAVKIFISTVEKYIDQKCLIKNTTS